MGHSFFKDPWEPFCAASRRVAFNVVTFICTAVKQTSARAWWSATPTVGQVKQKIVWYMVNEKIVAELTGKLGNFRKTWSPWAEYYFPNGLEDSLWTL